MNTVEKTNEKCNVRDTHLCEYLGVNGCEKCMVNAGVRNYHKEKMRDIWEVTLFNLPDDVDELHESETCQFCKGETKNPAIGYGLADFAHEEPITERGFIMGMGTKVKQPIGSMVQIPISICSECKKHYAMKDRIKWIGVLGGMALTFAILAIVSLFTNLSGTMATWPLLLLILLTVGGFYLGKIISNAYVKKHRKETAYNVFEIPIAQEMAERGWFGFKEDEGMTRLRFSRKKPWDNFMVIPENYVRPEKLDK